MRKDQLVIASSHFLHRLGVKTMLSVIGVEPELLEVDCVKQLREVDELGVFPDFIIITSELLPKNQQSFISELQVLYQDCKILVVGDADIALKQGVHQVYNRYSQKEILEQFQNFFFSPEPHERDVDKSLLSEREVDVLKSVALGFSNKEIAEQLFISINTVISHRKNITEKLGIKTIAGLTVYAMIHNIISPDDAKQ